jgi:hypothetical protein
MAFELVGATRSETIDVADELLFDVARLLQPSSPLLRRLEREFYDSPMFSRADAIALAEELTRLATSLAAAPQAAQRAWAERPAGFRAHVMPESPDAAAVVAKLEALAETCRDAAKHGSVLKGLSD